MLCIRGAAQQPSLSEKVGFLVYNAPVKPSSARVQAACVPSVPARSFLQKRHHPQGARLETLSGQQGPHTRRLEEATFKGSFIKQTPEVPRRKGNTLPITTACLPIPSAHLNLAASLFTIGTAFVMPFYTCMILAPDWPMTKKMLDSSIPYVILGAMYIYLLYLSWRPETLPLMFSSQYWLPELPGITRMFSSTLTVASAWIHLLAVDLFAGRHVFLDGLMHKVETRHSLVLCLMFGPIGITCSLGF
eukprot:jgi/Mesen1/10493/ME000083S10001